MVGYDSDTFDSSGDESSQARLHHQYGVEVPIAGKRAAHCRAGTVNGPLSLHYYSAKAALIRATGCLQVEVDILGYNDIHLYALHPGGCKSERHGISRRKTPV